MVVKSVVFFCLQDEAPAESNTVSGPEDHITENAHESDRESPVLETKQVPSPLV